MVNLCSEEGRKIRYENSELTEILTINEVPMNVRIAVIVPNIYSTIYHSRTCRRIWEAFENVINRMSSKKYSDESKMKSSMNTMLFNELCKKGIMLRLGRFK